MTRRYFGTDGIRGRANQAPMTPDIVLKVAMATAGVLRARRNGQQTERVIIGKDTRLSGYMLEEVMCSGFVAMGMDVLLTGPIPTPGIALLTRSLRADIGVMISASHNPFEDNGIKLFGADGYKLPDDIEREIEAKMETDLDADLALPADLGKASRLEDALGRYAEYLKSAFPKRLTLEGLRVAVDCAHGAAYKIAPQLLWELEAEVMAIGTSPNGKNINEGHGATDTKNLQNLVVDQKADIGIALDGDADRLIVVDETGAVVDGDQIMAALCMAMQRDGKLNQAGLVTTVMSNLGLERFLKNNGVPICRTQVGDRYVMEAMRDADANIGGEQSGHIILSDYGTTGDGLMAALHVLALVKESGQRASEVLKCFEPVPQILKNVTISGGNPLAEARVQDAITQAEQTLSNDGRVLVRASGTQPLIRVMAEGDDLGRVETVVDELCGVIAAHADVV